LSNRKEGSSDDYSNINHQGLLPDIARADDFDSRKRKGPLRSRVHCTKPKGFPATEGGQSRIGREFRLAVERHFRTITSVSDYAKTLHVTADHLGAVVREETGRPPGDIIRERLLLEAKRLLVHTSMNVSEIAYALNFEDPAYFSRFFRRLTEKAPGNFREEFSEKHQT
jgi:AraC-like DNA-binding protein